MRKILSLMLDIVVILLRIIRIIVIVGIVSIIGIVVMLFFMCRESDPMVMSPGVYEIEHDAYDVYVKGNYAYVIDYEDGLRIIDISDKTNPIDVGYYNMNDDNEAYNVYVVGNYAYVTDYECISNARQDKLRIIDISDKTNPRWVGYYYVGYYAYDVYVKGNYAYVIDYEDGLRIIDISDKTNPREVGYYRNGFEGAYEVYVKGNYAYIAYGDNEFRIIDIRDKTNPREVGFCSVSLPYILFPRPLTME